MTFAHAKRLFGNSADLLVEVLLVRTYELVEDNKLILLKVINVNIKQCTTDSCKHRAILRGYRIIHLQFTKTFDSLVFIA